MRAASCHDAAQPVGPPHWMGAALVRRDQETYKHFVALFTVMASFNFLHPASVTALHRQLLLETIAGRLKAAGPLNDAALASSTYFFMPGGLATDSSSNLYVADSGDSRIRMISPSGMVSTIAGARQASRPGFSSDGGLAVNALLSWPKNMALDGNGNIYIADTGNNRVRLVNPAGIISTIAGTGDAQFGGDHGPATSAQLNNPSGIAVDQSRNIYVADIGNFRVRKIAPSGVISTFAGSGNQGHSGDGGHAIQAQLGSPLGLKFDASGNLYIADGGSVRMVTPAGVITTVAGNGTSASRGTAAPPPARKSEPGALPSTRRATCMSPTRSTT